MDPYDLSLILLMLYRLETVNVKKIQSLAKVIGTVITVSGAMVMTLYKGPILDIIRGHGHAANQNAPAESSDHHWVTGTLMLVGSCGGWASFFIVQVSIVHIIINSLRY